MSDLRDALARKQAEARPAPGAFERLASRRRRREFRRRLTAATSTVVVVVLGTVAAIRLFGVGRSTEQVTPAGPPVVVNSVLLERSPAVLAGGLGSLWIAEEPSVSLEGAEFQADERLLRLDPETAQVTGEFPIAAAAAGSSMEVGQGAVWLGGLGTVSQIDPDTGTRVDAFGFGANPTTLAIAREEAPDSPLRGVWVSTPLDDALHHILPVTGEVTTIGPVGDRPIGVAAGEGAVWAVLGGDAAVARVDPASGKVVATVPVSAPTGPITVGLGAVWVSTAQGVASIDPSLNRVAAIVRLGSSPHTLAVGVGLVWAATDEGISAIDPVNNVASRVLDVTNVRGLAPSAGGMWAATEQELLLLQPGRPAPD
jgi:streptogramin lyase